MKGKRTLAEHTGSEEGMPNELNKKIMQGEHIARSVSMPNWLN